MQQRAAGGGVGGVDPRRQHRGVVAAAGPGLTGVAGVGVPVAEHQPHRAVAGAAPGPAGRGWLPGRRRSRRWYPRRARRRARRRCAGPGRAGWSPRRRRNRWAARRALRRRRRCAAPPGRGGPASGRWRRRTGGGDRWRPGAETRQTDHDRMLRNGAAGRGCVTLVSAPRAPGGSCGSTRPPGRRPARRPARRAGPARRDAAAARARARAAARARPARPAPARPRLGRGPAQTRWRCRSASSAARRLRNSDRQDVVDAAAARHP